jgi:hypothetical protein
MNLKYLQINPFVLLATILFIALIYSGVRLIFFKDNDYTTRDKRYIFRKMKNKFIKFDKGAVDEEFVKAGLKISFGRYYKTYENIRYLLFVVAFIFLVIKATIQSISINSIVIFVLLYIFTVPKLKAGKKFTPFGYVMKQLDAELKRKQDLELSSIIIQLQNIAVSQQHEPTTLSYMLTRVVRFSRYTKTALIKMISFLDQGKEAEAREAFENEIGTALSRDLSYILIQLDRIEPIEVVNQLKLLEARIRNENLTNKNRKEELNSDLMYIVPIALNFVILLNFLNIILNMIMNFKI